MTVKSTILKRLKDIEREENVTILFAVESGSRAWNIASLDSDYDVRFVYVRRRDDYLKLNPIRDVLEYPIDDLLDINGWDIKKALLLLNKSNPTIIEWLNSSIIYMKTMYMNRMQELLPFCFDESRSLYHYLNMARNNYQQFLTGDEVKAKKYFYCLRPLLSCDWILEHNCPPPLPFNELVDAQLPLALHEEVSRLLEIKVNVPELRVIPRIESINQYVMERIDNVSMILQKLKSEKKADLEVLDHFFADVVNQCSVAYEQLILS